MVSAGFTSLTFALFFELLPPQEDNIKPPTNEIKTNTFISTYIIK